MAQIDFDASTVPPNASFEPVPPGTYLATIVESEIKKSKVTNCDMLTLTFEIQEGTHKARKLWVNLNLNHPKPDVRAIAQGQLSAICRAAGVIKLKDSVELHNLPMLIVVRSKRREDTGEIQNVISGWRAREQQSPTAAPAWRK